MFAIVTPPVSKIMLMHCPIIAKFFLKSIPFCNLWLIFLNAKPNNAPITDAPPTPRAVSKTTFIFDETTVGDEDKLYVEDDICNAETKADLHAAIQTLNPAYREVIYLSYFNNLSNEEIAIIIKKSKRQTELLLYRAKQSLKSALEKEGFIYG